MSVDTRCHKFGPVWLAPDITKANAWTLMYAAFFTIGLLSFIAIGTPYVLTEILEAPANTQGVISGNLVLVTEIVTLLIFGPVGIAADRIGRKSVYLFGFLTMGLGYFLYPLAGSVTELMIYRVIYAVGVATCTGMLATIVTDYPQEASRGKLVGIVGAMNGLGVVAVNRLFGTMPDWLVNAGFDGAKAGEYTLWAVAALCLISVGVLAVGLKDGTPASEDDKPPVRELAESAIRRGRENPRIMISYAAAFIARGDLVILATFLTLWGTTAGVADGMTTAAATRGATLAFVLAQGVALIWTVLLILFIDRFNRVGFLAFCMGLAAIGYLGMLFIDNPLDPDARLLIAVLGVGQISAFLGSQSLVGQEAPLAERGAVVGGFNVSGAVGILVCSVLGGWLFDTVSPHATFAMVGCINGLVCLGAIYVRLTAPGRMPGEPNPNENAVIVAPIVEPATPVRDED